MAEARSAGEKESKFEGTQLTDLRLEPELRRSSAPPLYLSLHCSYRGEANLNLDPGHSVSYCNLRTGPTCPARQSAIYNLESRMEWLTASGSAMSRSFPELVAGP
jgi:hypothetical protein